MLMEGVTTVVFLTERNAIPLSERVLDALASLAVGRIFVLLLMSGLLIRREWQVRRRTVGEEGRSLLENGDGPVNGYGASPSSGTEPKPKQARALGWVDYIASFQVLFPYLW